MKISRTTLHHLGMVSIQQLNLFPAKGGISEYLSPHVIMAKTNIDYNKHCQCTFGTYVQANQENNPTNTQAPRTIDAIYLRPLKNVQGSHELMNLATGSVITRNKVWERPATEMVIKAVEDMAEQKGIKTSKLTNRSCLYRLIAVNCECYFDLVSSFTCSSFSTEVLDTF